jgi:isoleucyl-tRNA synthetase
VDGEGKKMSKSLGNTIAPEEVIQKYGADIIRLWAIASDYSVDVRISEEILGQLVDSYRKIRNTIRFMLGNLNGFDPKTELLPTAELENIDRFILHRLQELTETVLDHYRNWQFHLIVKEVLSFCNTDLSSFYLDIVKDKLYCSGPTKPRHSSQTAIYHTLRNILSLFAPVLVFTTEEAFRVFTEEILGPKGLEAEESVHLTTFPQADPLARDDKLASVWNTLIAVRRDVLKPIEELRVDKTIGHSLESEVYLYADGETYDVLHRYRDELAQLFVVSKVTLDRRNGEVADAFRGENLDVRVVKSDATKCERCWRYLESVGRNDHHPDLCERCASVVDAHYSDSDATI